MKSEDIHIWCCKLLVTMLKMKSIRSNRKHEDDWLVKDLRHEQNVV